MASWLILLIKQFLDILKYIMIGNAVFKLKLDKDKHKFILMIILVVIFYIFFNGSLIKNWLAINLIVSIIFLINYYQGKLIIRVKILIISIAISTLIEQFFDLFIQYSPTNFYSYQFILSNSLNFGFIILFSSIVKIANSKNRNYSDIVWYIYMNIIIGFSATLFPLYIVIIYNNVLSRRLSLITTTIAYINIGMSIISIYLFVKNKKEKEEYYVNSILKDKTLILQEGYYQKLIDNYSDIRRFKHDIKGHLNIIDGLVRNYENEKANKYINEISKSMINKDIYHTNNIYISTILNSFDQVFKDDTIIFELSYYITKHINMDSMDICSLFYNLISNAIESNLKINDSRYIKLYIAEIKNNIVIKLVNPVDDDFSLNVIKENRTTKQDKENHGFGLITINNIVSKYRGSIDYSMMDTDLIIDIVLFNTLKTED